MNKLPISTKIKTTATALLLATAMAIPSPVMPVNAAEVVNMSLTPSFAASASLKLSKANATLYPKGTVSLALGKVANKNIVWASTNPKVAKVNSKGVVTAVKKGNATIIAIYKGRTYNCNVTVKAPEINTSSATLNVGETLKLKLNGTTATSFTSSDKKVATVNSNGLVTAVSGGDVTIKAVGKDGNTYKCNIRILNASDMDLGGMEIIIRDWWTSETDYEPTNKYEEAVKAWQDNIQETYNFKIKRMAISDWGSDPTDFVDYVTSGGDKNNYVFVLREDPAVSEAMFNGLMYDLSTIDWFNFSDPKFSRNKASEKYSLGSSVYCMNTGYSEPRTGVFFNKKLLKAAGIDPDSLYDMQANGTWTWDKFDELCEKVTKKGYYGITLNEGVMTLAAVYSNNGSYIGKNKNGSFYYNLESPETLEALNWAVGMYSKYDNHDPEGAQWDYYKSEFLSGNVAFMIEDAYCGTPGNFLTDATFDIGYVMFPKGPKATTYVNCWSNNIYAIPACYDKDRAEKIAFALNLYTQAPSGYEDYKDLAYYNSDNSIFDSRAIKETIPMMMDPAHGIVEYHSLISNLQIGPDVLWSVYYGTSIPALTAEIRDSWKKYVADTNSNFKK